MTIVFTLACNCFSVPLAIENNMRGRSGNSNSFPHCRVWRYEHADFQRANEMLCDLDLNNILDPTDIQTSWLCFKTAFLDVMEQCIPQSVVPNLPWLIITKTMFQLIKKRNDYFKKVHGSRSSIDYSKFKQFRSKVVSELRLAKQKFFSNLHHQTPKEFWKIIRSLSPRKSSSSPLKSENTIATSGLNKANLLNVTFTSHYNRSIPESPISNFPEVVLTSVVIVN